MQWLRLCIETHIHSLHWNRLYWRRIRICCSFWAASQRATLSSQIRWTKNVYTLFFFLRILYIYVNIGIIFRIELSCAHYLISLCPVIQFGIMKMSLLRPSGALKRIMYVAESNQRTEAYLMDRLMEESVCMINLVFLCAYMCSVVSRAYFIRVSVYVRLCFLSLASIWVCTCVHIFAKRKLRYRIFSPPSAL